MTQEEKMNMPHRRGSVKLYEPIEPVSMFDDLFFVGNQRQGIYILKTSQGLVLMEATDDVDACESILEPGLKKLGLNSQKICALLITHGHLDHYLGAPGIREKYGCPVYMSPDDAAYMSWCHENMGPGKPLILPRVDQLIRPGDVLTYGDHQIEILDGAGHTPGCLNFAFDVHDKGERHHAVMMGGFGIFGPGRYPGEAYPYGVQWSVDQALAYASSCVRLWEHCKANGADVFYNPHPHLCGLLDHAREKESRREGDPNAFIIGREGVRAFILDRFQASLEAAQAFTDLPGSAECVSGENLNLRKGGAS